MTTADPGEPVPGEGERGAVDDSVWTELVAAFHASPGAPSDQWPDVENLSPGENGRADAPGGPWPGPPGGGSRVVRPAVRPGEDPGPDGAERGPGGEFDADFGGSGGIGPDDAGHSVPDLATWPDGEPGADRPRQPRQLKYGTGAGGLTYWNGTLGGPRDYEPAEPGEEPYEPPVPPPLPELSAPAKGAILALIGGPGYLVVSAIMHWQTPEWAALLCVLAGVAGFGYLVSRLKSGKGDDDDPPDPNFGAVV